MGLLERTSRLVLVVSVLLTLAWTAPYRTRRDIRLRDALNYLKNFGYLEVESTQWRSGGISSATKALKKFQKMNHLNETGRLDGATRHKMSALRCGNKDIIPEITGNYETSARIRRDESKYSGLGTAREKCVWPFWRNGTKYNFPKCFITTGDSEVWLCPLSQNATDDVSTIRCNWWYKKQLTWRLLNYLSYGPSEDEQMLAFQRATEYWSAVADIQFQKVPEWFEGADMTFSFQKYIHGELTGDKDDFDFSSNPPTVGHMEMPSYGWMHILTYVKWIVGEKVPQDQGVNLQWVIIHELGHGLGLMHNFDSVESVMHPWYPDGGWYEPHDQYRLPDVDAAALQELYGPKKNDRQ